MNLEFIKPQHLSSLLMESSLSNFDLRSPGSYLVRSYLIATVTKKKFFLLHKIQTPGINMQNGRKVI